MGTADDSDGRSIGIMQRRAGSPKPDDGCVRGGGLGARRRIPDGGRPKPWSAGDHRLGGLSALAAALLLLPMLALRRDDGPGGASAIDGSAPAPEAEPVGEVLTGSPRYTSAEALETEPVAVERRTA
jgi:hypothetical protein